MAGRHGREFRVQPASSNRRPRECGNPPPLPNRVRDGRLPAEKMRGKWMVRACDVETMAERIAAAEKARLKEIVAEVVAKAPPLSEEQKTRLRQLLAG